MPTVTERFAAFALDYTHEVLPRAVLAHAKLRMPAALGTLTTALTTAAQHAIE